MSHLMRTLDADLNLYRPVDRELLLSRLTAALAPARPVFVRRLARDLGVSDDLYGYDLMVSMADAWVATVLGLEARSA